MSSARLHRRHLALLAMATLLAAGCAAFGRHREPAHVRVESRPTPPQPDSSRSNAARSRHTTVSPSASKLYRQEISRDTAAARAALQRCAGRKLLPDQESVFDATNDLLERSRASVAQGDLSVAASYARQARQLSSSLNCH